MTAARLRTPGGVRENGAMPQMRVALAQVNTRVGDIAGNSAVVVERTHKM